MIRWTSCVRYISIISDSYSHLLVRHSTVQLPNDLLATVRMADSAPFKGVEVEVISNGQSLPLYDDPDAAENDELRTRQNYIEAVTGATFSIKVTLSEEFEMGRCDAARISMTCDNSERTSHKDVMAGSQRRIGPLQDRQVVFCRMSGFCQDSGQWKSGKYCFGKLVMGECIRVTMGQNLIWRYLQLRPWRRIFHQWTYRS